MPAEKKGWKSFTAGAVAGAVEGTVNYPFEFAKTRLQLVPKGSTASRNPLVLIYRVVSTQGLSALYVGCPVFVLGNTAKAGVRFLGFDTIKKFLADKDGKLSGPRGVLAGAGAGLLESIFAVTPAESVKTAMIDDRQLEHPKYQHRGGSLQLIRELGLRGVYKGFIPVVMRQGANQAVRMGTYSRIKGAIQQYSGNSPDKPLSTGMTFLVGAFAGLVTVYTTMPIDTVKTRMQALDARKRYKGTFDCFVQIFKGEGVLAFWKGATPRLGRLLLGGGIVFTIYEKMMVLLN